MVRFGSSASVVSALLAIGTLSFLFALPACDRDGGQRDRSRENPKSVTAGRGAPLRVQLSAEPASLDPALSEDGVSLRILHNTMEGLLGYDGDGVLRNLAAESYVVSPDGRRYEFSLRPRARWSDGKPVTAADFVTGLRRALHPGSGAKLAGMLFPIRGAREFHQGRGKESDLSVRDEGGKLVIELHEPAPYFIQALSLAVAMPERQDVLSAHGGKWPTDAPCNGPYLLVRGHQAGQRFRLEPNPHYWSAERASPPVEVDVFVVADETTGLNLFEQGKLDILTKVPASDVARLRKAGALRTDPFLATFYLSFNHRKAPFNDAVWRRAVAGSVRREELVRALDLGDRPARSWVPPGLEGYLPYSDPSPAFAPAVRDARARGAPQTPVAAAYDSGSRNTTIMEKVQQDLRASLGLKLSLSNLDWKSYLKAVQTDPPPLFRLGILSPFMDPIQILSSFATGDPNNYLRFSNPRYDALVKEIGRLPPGPKREARIRAAQEILVDREAIVVPLYHYAQNHLVAPRVRNFRVNPFGVIRFSELGVD